MGGYPQKKTPTGRCPWALPGINQSPGEPSGSPAAIHLS